jgi:glycosyltransferase involved in cell wall biosynthesis
MGKDISDWAFLYEKNFNPDEEYLGRDKEVNRIIPLVSVSVITYQHADFIEECLQGILMQKTDFPFEIIVGEDQSTDGTREICKTYAEKYPDNIRLFLRDRNTSGIFDEEGNRIGGFNGKWNRKSARGKYIAICDGDDYWTDPQKLNKQVKFLESFNEFVGIATDYATVNESNKLVHKKGALKKDKHLIGSIYTTNSFPKTSTVMYRNIKLNKSLNISNLPVKNGDVILYYYMIQFGKFALLNEVCCHYRLHMGSVYSSNNLYNKYSQTFKTIESIRPYKLRNGVQNLIEEKFNKYSNRLYILSLLKLDFNKVRYYRGKISSFEFNEIIKTIIKNFQNNNN